MLLPEPSEVRPLRADEPRHQLPVVPKGHVPAKPVDVVADAERPEPEDRVDEDPLEKVRIDGATRLCRAGPDDLARAWAYTDRVAEPAHLATPSLERRRSYHRS
jgi:hypothetical protein